MTPKFAPADPSAIAIRLVSETEVGDVLESLPELAAAWIETYGFSGALGEVLALPSAAGRIAEVLVGTGKPAARARRRFAVGAAIAHLPEGIYALTQWPSVRADAEEIGLGYLFAQYRFNRYKSRKSPTAKLVAPSPEMARDLENIAAGEVLTRWLIDTPAADMGPGEIADETQRLAAEFGATCTVLVGDDLLTGNFPLIHSVGRAADRAPRLIDMDWSGAEDGPRVTLVGKGVAFDTGGLNLKPGSSMGLMKKDMGGAATVLGLARMIMGADLPINLRVVIPAVENAVSGNAFRPGDILTARDGRTVEINNTDAEGRLILADALALAAETPPDLLISMATLTGAARVALGADIAPFFTDDNDLAADLAQAASEVADPVWRMPFHAPYEAMIEPGIADLDNAPKGGFAGAVTAALFLRRFTNAHPRYIHFDIYGWSPAAAPARTKGGVGQGARALFRALPQMVSP